MTQILLHSVMYARKSNGRGDEMFGEGTNYGLRFLLVVVFHSYTNGIRHKARLSQPHRVCQESIEEGEYLLLPPSQLRQLNFILASRSLPRRLNRQADVVVSLTAVLQVVHKYTPRQHSGHLDRCSTKHRIRGHPGFPP